MKKQVTIAATLRKSEKRRAATARRKLNRMPDV
jgi:hypothetical protein